MTIEKNYSQNNEQSIIMSYLEKNNMDCGRFLDIGAYDPEKFSNVRAIMLQYEKWKGVFVEPSSFCFSKLFDAYRNQPRRAELINIAVLLEDDINKQNGSLIEFYESPNSAASSTIVENINIYCNKKNEDGDMIDPRKIFVGGIGMKELLRRFHGTFDMINIDVEGISSKLVLQDWFNPRDYNCKLLCIEVDLEPFEIGSIPQVYRKKMNDKFFSLGYKLIGSTPENQIFGL